MTYKVVNAFVFRGNSIGDSIDVTFFGREAIEGLITEIRAVATSRQPGTLDDLANELQQGLAHIDADRTEQQAAAS